MPGRNSNELRLFWVKTPAAILARLEAEARKALALPETKERFDKVGLYVVGNSSAEFRPFVAESEGDWARSRSWQAYSPSNGDE